jgi:6-phosphogluconolactonase
MKYVLTLIALLIYSMTLFSQQNNLTFYVSSYDSNYPAGIAQYQLNLSSGKIVKVHEFDAEANSDYLAISNNNNFLFSISQDEDANTGLITSYMINPDNGNIRYLDEEFSHGSGPCHLALDLSCERVMVAHYGEGNVTVTSIKDNGNLHKLVENIKHQGSGPNQNRQEGPHPHMVYYSSKGNYIFVPDLGLDKIMVYKLNAAGHLLAPKSPYGSVAPGAGPRHFVLHPNGKFGYVVNELNSTVTAFLFNKKTGALTEVQTANSLLTGFDGDNYLADVHISPDGKFLYASNRGHDSISIFSIDMTTGGITLLANENCGGKWPRAFAIDPTGNFLISANERSDNMVVFRIDKTTGLLTKTFESSEFPGPRCVKFLH